MRLRILLLLCLLFTAEPPDPHLSAVWDSATSATVQWTQQQRACLSVTHASGQAVFIGCYDGTGRARVTLGGAQTDGAYRPQPGDVYTAEIDGQTEHAPLVARPQYLAVLRA